MATNKPIRIDELHGDLVLCPTAPWYVVHTKPRQEKKLAEFCLNAGVWYYLPQTPREHIYQHRKIVFDVPLFPGYIFLSLNEQGRDMVKVSGAIVNIIKVINQKSLLQELESIKRSKDRTLRLEDAAWLDRGLEVMVIRGPLKGIHGVVENHEKIEEVQLQIEILRQAVKVRIKSSDLKIMGSYKLVEEFK